jgi:hypothetical protein
LGDGKDAAAIMTGEGLARPYSGETKPDWCAGVVWKPGTRCLETMGTER